MADVDQKIRVGDTFEIIDPKSDNIGAVVKITEIMVAHPVNKYQKLQEVNDHDMKFVDNIKRGTITSRVVDKKEISWLENDDIEYFPVFEWYKFIKKV